MNYKISQSVFYRLYGDSVTLYHTGKRQVFYFNAIVKDILDCFEHESNAEIAISKLAAIYEVREAKAFERSIHSFIQDLSQLEILEIRSFQRGGDELYNNLNKDNVYSSVMIELTNRCNAKCRHCCIVDDEKDELNTAEVFRVLDELYELNTLSIIFTGGEVFIRNDFMEILEYAIKKRFLVEIFTNGLLISDADLIKMARLKLKMLHFSLYSYIPEKHDYITQVKGSFLKTTDTIKKAVSLGFAVNIKTTVMDFNKNDTSGLIELSKDLSASIEISFPIYPKYNGDTAPTNFRLKSVEDYKAVMKVIADNIDIYGGVTESKEVKPRDENILCRAGDAGISISPCGEIFPCSALRIVLGNVKNKTIKEIWESSETLEEWKQLRCKKPKGCEDCEISEFCSFCPGAAQIETGDPLCKYSEACTLAVARKLIETGC